MPALLGHGLGDGSARQDALPFWNHMGAITETEPGFFSVSEGHKKAREHINVGTDAGGCKFVLNPLETHDIVACWRTVSNRVLHQAPTNLQLDFTSSSRRQQKRRREIESSTEGTHSEWTNLEKPTIALSVLTWEGGMNVHDERLLSFPIHSLLSQHVFFLSLAPFVCACSASNCAFSSAIVHFRCVNETYNVTSSW